MLLQLEMERVRVFGHCRRSRCKGLCSTLTVNSEEHTRTRGNAVNDKTLAFSFDAPRRIVKFDKIAGLRNATDGNDSKCHIRRVQGVSQQHLVRRRAVRYIDIDVPLANGMKGL